MLMAIFENIIRLLHPLLLNTKIYYTQGGNIQREWNIRHRGCNKSGIQYSRGCINCFIIHLNPESCFLMLLLNEVSRKNITDMRKNNNLVGVDNHGIQWRGVVLL